MRLMKQEKVVKYTKDGLTIFEVTHHVSPLFYRGTTPFTYQSGMYEMSFSKVAKWSEFAEFRIEYGSEGRKHIPGVGASIPATAIASSPEGKVVARAEVVELIKSSGFFVEEEHLGPGGEIVYTAKSFFVFDGEKQSESEARGKKEKEYFFLWPT